MADFALRFGGINLSSCVHRLKAVRDTQGIFKGESGLFLTPVLTL